MSDSFNSSSTSLFGDYVVKILAGSMRGMEFPIRKDEFYIGRSSDADIKIHDTLISRIHTRFYLEDDKWFIDDLNSTNGTWVEGQRINGCVPLPLQTSIRVGKTIFEMYDLSSSIEEINKANTSSFQFRIQPETLQEPLEDEKTGALSAAVRSENRRLAAVYKFQRSITGVLEEQELSEKILVSLVNLINYDNAALLFYDLDTSSFEPRYERAAVKGARTGSTFIDSNVVSYVQEKKEAVLSTEAVENGTIVVVPGVTGMTLSVMCVPIMSDKQVRAMLYLTLTSPNMKYSEEDLRLLTLVGHTADMAFEHSRIFQQSVGGERAIVAEHSTVRELSHLVKNIMAGLEGSLKLMSMGLEKENLKLIADSWGILDGNYQRLGNVSLDLVDIIGDREPNFSVTDACLIVNNVINECAKEFERDTISIKNNSPASGVPLYAEADNKTLSRVIRNLLLSARKSISLKSSSEERPVSGHVEITTEFNEHKDYINIVVEDDGQLIDNHFIDKCFSMEILSRGDVGSALGLAVCKKIVDTHHGMINVEPSAKGGACFTVSIPISHNDMSTTTMAIKRPTI